MGGVASMSKVARRRPGATVLEPGSSAANAPEQMANRTLVTVESSLNILLIKNAMIQNTQKKTPNSAPDDYPCRMMRRFNLRALVIAPLVSGHLMAAAVAAELPVETFFRNY